jgi:hypothetical protein
MAEQSVIVWDLETVPDLSAAARMLDLGSDAPETEVREALGSGFPKHPLHKIACIGALIASRQPEGWRIPTAIIRPRPRTSFTAASTLPQHSMLTGRSCFTAARAIRSRPGSVGRRAFVDSQRWPLWSRTTKPADCSSTDHGGGKWRAGTICWASDNSR